MAGRENRRSIAIRAEDCPAAQAVAYFDLHDELPVRERRAADDLTDRRALDPRARYEVAPESSTEEPLWPRTPLRVALTDHEGSEESDHFPKLHIMASPTQIPMPVMRAIQKSGLRSVVVPSPVQSVGTSPLLSADPGKA